MNTVENNVFSSGNLELEGAGESSVVDEGQELASVSISARKKDHSFDATKVYLNELSGSTLLSAEEEKVYGKKALQG
ncbi:MAG: hypothetical protein GQ529_09250, partial [Methyloprofundus sp.]|nr:hypothetical protein [Methyloprofundus sp.]